MRLINLFIAGMLLFGTAHAAQKVDEDAKSSPACKLLMRKIQETNEHIQDLSRENGKVPVATKNEAQERLAVLMALYDRAKGGGDINVKDELYSYTLRSTAAGASK